MAGVDPPKTGNRRRRVRSTSGTVEQPPDGSTGSDRCRLDRRGDRSGIDPALRSGSGVGSTMSPIMGGTGYRPSCLTHGDLLGQNLRVSLDDEPFLDPTVTLQ